LIVSDDTSAPRNVLVIGIGNEFGSDDALGLLAARELKARATEGCEILENDGSGIALIDCCSGARAIILIDASSSGAEPGSLRRFDATSQRLPATLSLHSSHAFGVAEAIELARVLRRLPPRLIVYAIEGSDFRAGTGVSAAAQAGVPALVDRVMADIRDLGWGSGLAGYSAGRSSS
jgi:hydrogenase maturation protease